VKERIHSDYKLCLLYYSKEKFSLELYLWNTIPVLIQGHRKVMQTPFLTHVLFLKKQITLKSGNREQCYIKFWKCPPRFISSLNTEGWPERFLSCTLPVSRKRFTRRYTIDFFWHRRIGKCILKIILVSYVRTRCQVVFKIEHSLHLWKRHPCTSTVWRQLTDWREQVGWPFIIRYFQFAVDFKRPFSCNLLFL
jgi:hypothetical protein